MADTLTYDPFQDDGFVSPTAGNFVNDLMRTLNQMVIFDPSVVSLTAGTSSLSQILSVSDNILLSGQVFLFRFIINPDTFSYSNKKIVKHQLEKKGWDNLWFDGTPNELLVLSFSGLAGSLVPPAALYQAGIMDIKFSSNYQRLMQLKSLILSSKNDLNLIYDGIMYTGVLQDFKFSQNAKDFYSIPYSFNFYAYPDRIENIASIDFSNVPTVGALPAVSNIFQSGVGL